MIRVIHDNNVPRRDRILATLSGERGVSGSSVEKTSSQAWKSVRTAVFFCFLCCLVFFLLLDLFPPTPPPTPPPLPPSKVTGFNFNSSLPILIYLAVTRKQEKTKMRDEGKRRIDSGLPFTKRRKSALCRFEKDRWRRRKGESGDSAAAQGGGVRGNRGIEQKKTHGNGNKTGCLFSTFLPSLFLWTSRVRFLTEN